MGDIIAAAINGGHRFNGAATSPMIMPEELATAMNKYFAGGYAAATPPWPPWHQRPPRDDLRVSPTLLGRRCVLRSLVTTLRYHGRAVNGRNFLAL